MLRRSSKGDCGSPLDNGSVIHWYETCSMASTETCSTVNTGALKNSKRKGKKKRSGDCEYDPDVDPFFSFYEQQGSMFAPTSAIICQRSSYNRSSQYHNSGYHIDKEYSRPVHTPHQSSAPVALRLTIHNDGASSDSGGFTVKDRNIGKVRGKVKSLLCSSGPYRKEPKGSHSFGGKRHQSYHNSTSTPFFLIDTKQSSGDKKKKKAGRGKYEFEDEEEAEIWIVKPRLLPQEMPCDMMMGDIEPLPMSIETYIEVEEELGVLQELIL